MRLYPYVTIALLGLSACRSNESPAEKTTPPAAPGAQAPADTTPTPSGGERLGSSFEGVLAIRTPNAKGENPDVLVTVKGDKLRLDSEQDSRIHSVFDGAAKKVTLILDSQQMAMVKPLPSVPDAGPGAPVAVVVKTGKHETIAGFDCEDWEVTTGAKHESLCVASGIPYFDFSGTAALHAGVPSTHTWADELRDKKAFPLRIIERDAAGKEISRTEVTRIVRQTIEDSSFQVPADFHMLNLPGSGAAPAPH